MRRARRFFARWQNWLALGLVGLFIVAAAGADRLAPHADLYWASELEWADDRFNVKPHPPGPETPLGTIALGTLRRQMDVYTALVRGARSALQFGLLTALGAATIGVLAGASSAYLGGVYNAVVMRVTDALLAVPVIVGVFLVQQAVLAARGTPSLMQVLTQPNLSPAGSAGWLGSMLARLAAGLDPVTIAVILFSWMPYARLTHALVLRLRGADFVEAARALGAGHRRILFRHLIPNSLSPAIVLLARDIGGNVLLQATFTFIGIGGGSEWGTVLVLGRDWIIGPGGNLLARWWVFFPVTAALVLFGVGWNLLGDGLNDWLNPRTTASSPGLAAARISSSVGIRNIVLPYFLWACLYLAM